MQISKVIMGFVTALTLASSVQVIAASASAPGTCKLTNTNAGKELYHGNCTINQKTTDSGSVYSIKMDNAQSFKFAGSGTNYMHGSHNVHFKDLGAGAIFTWDGFALSVTTEQQNTTGSGSSTPSLAEQACLRDVTRTTNNPDVVMLESSFSQAGTEVIVGVGPQKARWRCIGYSDGTTDGIEYRP